MKSSLICCENVTVTFEPLIAIKKLNIDIKKGDFIVVIGSNGSGKSTLLKLLRRQLKPSKGSVLMDKFLSASIGYCSQQSSEQLCESMTVAEHIKLYHPKLHLAELLTELAQFNPKLVTQINSPVEFLSGGERQALVLALILFSKPKILFLDEHTSALDPKTANSIMELTASSVQRYGVTCVMTTHEVDVALTYGNRLLAMQHGELTHDYSSAQKKLLTKEQLINECYIL